jgi:predicted CoA-substrate-specific enzyme activase
MVVYMQCFLGVDVGSVSTNLVLIDDSNKILESKYIRTNGQPIKAIKDGLKQLYEKYDKNIHIRGCGATGSGRQLAAAIFGADVIKNEITAHAKAAICEFPEVRTIIEIGGQDSKIILLRDGIVTDFAMNTVCAAGTGSFLDRQAGRMEIPIEEFGVFALRAEEGVRIAGRCAVFAESDMIHKQQAGHSKESIIKGLCEALARNFLSNLAKNKKLEEPIIFQGGVAANIGISAAFEELLRKKIHIPKYYNVMGAYGAAVLAKEKMHNSQVPSKFIGLACSGFEYTTRSFQCTDCTNNCEILEIYCNEAVTARWGDKCGKWGVSDKAVNL